MGLWCMSRRCCHVEAAPTNPVAELSTDALDFGVVQVGQSASLDLTVSNTGAGTLTGSLTSDVTVFAASPADISVASGESAVVTVTYTPSRDADDVGYSNSCTQWRCRECDSGVIWYWDK